MMEEFDIMGGGGGGGGTNTFQKSSRWNVYWRGDIPELLGVHVVGYEGMIPSLKRLLIREVIYIMIL